MLTSTITKTLDIPEEDGQTVTIRKLSHHQLSMAQDAKEDRDGNRAADKMGRLGASVGHLPQPTAEQKAKVEEDSQIPENKYDRMTVLTAGVTAWTYSAALPEAVKELDEVSAVWLFDEIMSFSLRSADEVKTSANGLRLSTDQAADVGLTN